jgi:SNF2 family DNA or RNA helicase
MPAGPFEIAINYDPVRLTGRLTKANDATGPIWERLRARAFADEPNAVITPDSIELSWPNVLSILREYGSKQQQKTLNFRFAPEGKAAELIKQFAAEVRSAAAARNSLVLSISTETIVDELKKLGFTKRSLRPFQLRDLQRLLSLPHGANFSVPGAGKTTVMLALHLLTTKPGHHLFVVAPKTAFPAWRSVLSECLDEKAFKNAEQFTILDGRPDQIERQLRSGLTRFVMSYDLMIRQSDIIANYLARQPVHLVLDEAHRMKAGYASQRGAFLISVATLPMRRDILTGTPMPQGPGDLAAQLAFLWPGQGLDARISSGTSPREVLGELYVRTTKHELGLPRVYRHFRTVDMAPGQLALYSVVRDESLRQIAKSISRRTDSAPIDYLRARRSVMRLLQLSTNPILAVEGITGDVVGLDSGIVDQVLSEGPSKKMRAVDVHVRELARSGEKTVVWTIFTDTIHELERMLADLNPVSLYGAVPSGDESDPGTREGRLARFHLDDACKVLIANPAAAGEGISLHTVCHTAIYVDRSYVSTHYLQSIDRIHRLGLPPNIETNIFIYQTKAPKGLGSIDYSVSRRLATKIRGLQQLLDDPDLHEIALDEENADEPIDFDVDLQDLVDLVAELEGRAGPPGDEDAGEL